MCCHWSYGAHRPTFPIMGSPSPSKVLAWGYSTWRRGYVTSWWVRMSHKFRWTLWCLYLPHFPWQKLSTSYGGMAFPMLHELRMSMTMMSSTILASCPFSFLQYVFFPLSSTLIFPLHCFTWWYSNGILMSGWPCCWYSYCPSCLPWSVYTYGFDGFACEFAMDCNTNVMGYMPSACSPPLWHIGNLTK